MYMKLVLGLALPRLALSALSYSLLASTLSGVDAQTGRITQFAPTNASAGAASPHLGRNASSTYALVAMDYVTGTDRHPPVCHRLHSAT